MGGGEDPAYGELLGVPFLVECGVDVMRRVMYCDLHIQTTKSSGSTHRFVSLVRA